MWGTEKRLRISAVLAPRRRSLVSLPASCQNLPRRRRHFFATSLPSCLVARSLLCLQQHTLAYYSRQMGTFTHRLHAFLWVNFSFLAESITDELNIFKVQLKHQRTKRFPTEIRRVTVSRWAARKSTASSGTILQWTLRRRSGISTPGTTLSMLPWHAPTDRPWKLTKSFFLLFLLISGTSWR